jgi:hypothetical protein
MSAASSTTLQASPCTPSTWRGPSYIPANASVAKKGVDYKISPQARRSTCSLPKCPLADRVPDQGVQAQSRDLQPDCRTARAGDGAGEMSLDDALKRISADIDEQTPPRSSGASGLRPPPTVASQRHPLLELPASIGGALLNIVDAPMRALQRVLGVPRIGWMFVAPNLAILGLFTFLPIVINFYFAFTGGVELYPSQRPFTGMENLATLFECENFLDPSTCRKDLFWRAIFNTATFALVQVVLMVGFALITALVLNRRFGRGFFRGVFFYPCCCRRSSSP